MKKGLIIGIVVALLLGGGGFFAWKTFLAPKEEKEVEKEEEVLSPEEIKKLKVDLPPVVTFLDEEDSHNANVAVTVQLSDEETKKEFEVKASAMKSLLISVLNSSKLEDLRHAKGKEELEQKLLEKMNKKLDHGEIKHLYITDYRVL
ncbi:flagellar basal body-associated FliL family protein (plasmid) [Pontibacillus sp. ALD_SL1]|uniref:flagellar basal body-associated FliL family protein n=1 Tax=Pontibacillus sp. ALD_SL1 TaxID=2777185 RepID=UPI001A96E383|nr:flagellar basal body-associated FliL family protein [Pontibacillus sp. ALD_SL1]QST02877.1 flagellar basal body-associated FliL family protein [Pontibacillus sp. ALD_SL1]